MFKNPIKAWTNLTLLQKKEARAFYISISPWLFGVIVFTIYPLWRSFQLSFTSYDLLSAPEFIGLGNVDRLINDRKSVV